MGVAGHQRRATQFQLIGQQDGGFLMAQLRDGDLAQEAFVTFELDAFIQDLGSAEGAGQRGQRDPLPGRGRLAEDLAEHFLERRRRVMKWMSCRLSWSSCA